MAFGDEFSLADVKSFALADFCERLGWPRRAFARELSTLCRLSRQEAAAQASDPVYDAQERVFVRQLADWVSARADVLEAYAKDIPNVCSRAFQLGLAS